MESELCRKNARARLPIQLVVACALAAPPAATLAEESRPDGLQAILADYRTLAVAGEGKVVRDRPLRLGRMDVTLVSGRVHPIATRAGVSAGFLFEGEGTFAYRAENPVERRLLESSLGRRNMLDLYRDGTFADRFDEVLVLSTFDALAEGPGAIARGDAEEGTGRSHAPARRTKELSKAMERMALDQILAAARLNGGRFMGARFRGGRMEMRHNWDEATLFSTRLSVWDPPESGYRDLTQTRLEGDARGEPATARLVDARVEVATQDNASGAIVSELTCRIVRDGIQALSFRLDSGEDPHVLSLKRVTDAEGRDLEFAHRQHRVLVRLPAVLDRGATVRLRFETQGDVFAADSRDDTISALEEREWLPLPDTWQPSPFTYTLDIKTHAPVVPVAAGEVKAFRRSGELVELQIEARVPKRWLPVVAGAYRTGETRSGDVPVRVHLLRDDDDLLARMMKRSAFFLDYLGKNLGPYREEALEVAEVPKKRPPVNGIGYAGMVLLTPYTLKRLAAGESEGDEILAHEIAHQWFGPAAFDIAREDAWLYQSAAEYLAVLAVDALPKEERGDTGLAQYLADWRHDSRKTAQVGSVEDAFLLTGWKAPWQAQRLIFGRGPLVLHMLRRMAGDERFFAILRRFIAAASQSGTGTTDLLQGAAGEVMGQDMGWFFDQWIRRGGIPQIRVDYRIDPLDDRLAVLAGRAEQPADETFKKMYIPIAIEMDDGHVEERTIVQDKPVSEFRLELPARPRRVSVDPQGDTLARYSVN